MRKNIAQEVKENQRLKRDVELHVKIDADLKRKLDKIATAAELSLSEVARSLLETALK